VWSGYTLQKETFHDGIGIPAPFGTPFMAIMDGEVVAIYAGKNSPRGYELVLRPPPEQSGQPLYL
jgi:murein DD-endopeptidase MepM/ murein hydrolase activator NlpD